METRFAGGEVSIRLGAEDKCAVNGTDRSDRASITFYGGRYGDDEVNISGTRKQLEDLGKKIYDELNRTEPQETTRH